VIRRLLTRFRRGNPVQSIWLGALLASPVWVNTLVYRPTSVTGTLLLLGGSLAGGYLIARVFLGSVSADLEEVRAQNLWLRPGSARRSPSETWPSRSRRSGPASRACSASTSRRPAAAT
jgi:hypothetical protein